MSAIIQMSNVSFAYGKCPDLALCNVSLSIEEGSFVGVIGPSGAGKSTLARALSGAIPHHYPGSFYGNVSVGGLDTCEASLTDIAHIVGSVLQDIDTQMVASCVEDEMLFGLENFGVPHGQIEERLDFALEATGIADLRNREIATLSGGQKQKVAIAAILALAPRVLILDEPTAALDPVSSRAVLNVLRQVQRTGGVTVILIEQMVALLVEYCERIIVLDKGAVALDGSPHEVLTHAERLRAIGVDSPRTARISNSLASLGLVEVDRPALSVDEAESLVLRALGAGMGDDRPCTGPRVAPRVAHPTRAAEMPSGGEGVAELAGVSFSYGTGAASVDDIDLIVRPHEVLGVVGQNGAGKTTLTKLLNGLLKPSSGVVRIAGADTRTTPVSALARQVATLFQNPDRQLCRNTVLEEVAFGLELQGIPQKDAFERAGSVIERFGLAAEATPFTLSRGMRQMVALASVVVLDPKLIILDEPTSGLDYRECMTVMEAVREQADEGAAVVMVCHDMEVVSDFATSLAVMARGRVLATGPARQIFSDRELMRQADIEAPQVVELAARLTVGADPSFAGITEVRDLVQHVRELRSRA